MTPDNEIDDQLRRDANRWSDWHFGRALLAAHPRGYASLRVSDDRRVEYAPYSLRCSGAGSPAAMCAAMSGAIA